MVGLLGLSCPPYSRTDTRHFLRLRGVNESFRLAEQNQTKVILGHFGFDLQGLGQSGNVAWEGRFPPTE
jgi:hypothetical protein